MIFRRVAVFFAMVCGLAASQVPEFAQQYRQRLGGALDELHAMLTQFDTEAAALGLTRQQGAQKLEASPDDLAKGRGQAVETADTRAQKLDQQLKGMAAPNTLDRLVALGRSFDTDVAARALQTYEPAVPLTTEALAIGLTGFVSGWLMLHGLAWPVRSRLAKRDAQKRAEKRAASLTKPAPFTRT